MQRKCVDFLVSAAIDVDIEIRICCIVIISETEQCLGSGIPFLIFGYGKIELRIESININVRSTDKFVRCIGICFGFVVDCKFKFKVGNEFSPTVGVELFVVLKFLRQLFIHGSYRFAPTLLRISRGRRRIGFVRVASDKQHPACEAESKYSRYHQKNFLFHTILLDYIW